MIGPLSARLTTIAGTAGASVASLAMLDVLDRRRISADPLAALLAEHPPADSRTVRGRDGTPLHVELHGPEDAPPIVLVHGWTCTSSFWRLQLHGLAHDHRLIAYDLRGHGRSGVPEGGDWSPDAMADDLEAVLEHCVGERRAVLVGHSVGAMTIVAWAGRYPEAVPRRAAAAALLNTGLGDLVSEALFVRTPDALGRVRQGVATVLLGAATPLPSRPSPISHRAVRAVALSAAAGPAQVRFCEEQFLHCRPRVRAALGRELSRLDLRERVHALRVPTLVVCGGADRLTPVVHARRLADELPVAAGLLELDETGHMAPVERPDEVSAALRELVAQHSPAAAIRAAAPGV